MTPETRERFAVLVERRLAGLLGDSETAELSGLLETSEDARELYFRAVEFHLDLRRALGQPAIPEKAESRKTPKAVVRPPKRKLDAALLAAAGFLVVVAFGYRMLREPSPPDESASLPRVRALPNVNMTPGSVRSTPKPFSAPPDLPPPPPPAAVAIESVPVPAELINDINGRFAALPAGYRSLLAGNDRTKLDELTKSRKGTLEDLDWLVLRILGEAMPAFQRDADMIRTKLLELEPKLVENAAGDVITFKDGRRLEGQIIEETPESVKVKVRFGAVLIPKEQIQTIVKGKGVALEFPARLAEAMKPAVPSERLEKLEPLLGWCVEKNLKDQKEYTAYKILMLDASHEKARAAVGLARPAIPK